MAYTHDIIERLKGLNLQSLLTESIEETADKYVDLNLSQMEQGVAGTGQKIKPNYRRAKYARLKNEMNPLPGYGTPDGKLTGAFYKGYKLQVQGQELIKNSDVPYADDLFNRYGNAIGQLDEVNHEIYVEEELAPVLYNKVRDQTGLL